MIYVPFGYSIINLNHNMYNVYIVSMYIQYMQNIYTKASYKIFVDGDS